jgi:hypothetical protein
MNIDKIRNSIDKIFNRQRLMGVKVTAVRGEKEIVLLTAYCEPSLGYPLIPKGYDLLIEPIYVREERTEEMFRIKKAIEILGRPVMSYAPKIAMKEYDKKISEATNILLKVISGKEK